MKIRPEHYSTLVEAIANWLRDNPAYPDRASAELSHSAKRIRWDVFRFARVSGDSIRWLCDVLYPYMNDEHMDTALRRAMRDCNA